jgi:hypothetical protein
MTPILVDDLDECEHQWKEIDSQFSNENETDVRCVKCQTQGSKNNKTGNVVFPAT